MSFADFAGTESYMLTIAQQLERLGHQTTIYATRTGSMSEFAARQGIRVVDSISKLPSSADAVLVQDASTAYELAAKYPTAVRVYALHSAYHALQSPPQLEDVCHAILVLNDRLRRHAEQLAWRSEVVRLRQPVDLSRFSIPGTADRDGPPRVLALGNHRDPARLRVIEDACRTAGLELVRAGADRQTPTPEHAIAGAQIVISLGRGVLEAMACGRAAYVFGRAGGDGWVTTGTYPAFERDGFSGRATDASIDAARLAEDLRGWEPEMGESNRDLVWAHHDAKHHVVELVELVRRLDGGAPRPLEHFDELARLVRVEWSTFERAQGAIAENARLRAEIDALRQEVDALTEEARFAHESARQLWERIDELERLNRDLGADLDAVLRTRRYRLARAIARPVDLLRVLFGRE